MKSIWLVTSVSYFLLSMLFLVPSVSGALLRSLAETRSLWLLGPPNLLLWKQYGLATFVSYAVASGICFGCLHQGLGSVSSLRRSFWFVSLILAWGFFGKISEWGTA